jgi:hypothetical protein
MSGGHCGGKLAEYHPAECMAGDGRQPRRKLVSSRFGLITRDDVRGMAAGPKPYEME